MRKGASYALSQSVLAVVDKMCTRSFLKYTSPAKFATKSRIHAWQQNASHCALLRLTIVQIMLNVLPSYQSEVNTYKMHV